MENSVDPTDGRTEVQREAQTSASCYAQLNTSNLLHTGSLHRPEQTMCRLFNFESKTNDLKDLRCDRKKQVDSENSFQIRIWIQEEWFCVEKGK